MLFAAHAAAAAVAFYGNDWAIPVHVQYNKWTSSSSSGCSPSEVCTLSEKRFTLDRPLSLRTAIAFFSVISGLHHLIAAGFSSVYWDRCVLSGFNIFRVIDYTVTSPLMLLVNDVLWTAPPDLGKITSLVAAQALVVVCGAASEYIWSIYFRDSKEVRPTLRLASIGFFAVPLAIFAGLWAVLWYVFGVAVRDPGFRVDGLLDTEDVATPPDFVYAFLATLFITFLVFPAIHFLRITKQNATSMLETERDEFLILNEAAYCFASFASKIPLLILYRFGVSARSDSVVLLNPLDNITDVRNKHANSTGREPADAGTLAGSSVGVSILLGVISLYLLRRSIRSGKSRTTKCDTDTEFILYTIFRLY